MLRPRIVLLKQHVGSGAAPECPNVVCKSCGMAFFVVVMFFLWHGNVCTDACVLILAVYFERLASVCFMVSTQCIWSLVHVPVMVLAWCYLDALRGGLLDKSVYIQLFGAAWRSHRLLRVARDVPRASLGGFPCYLPRKLYKNARVVNEPSGFHNFDNGVTLVVMRGGAVLSLSKLDTRTGLSFLSFWPTAVCHLHIPYSWLHRYVFGSSARL